MTDSKSEIINDLEPMIREAEQKGFWLQTFYQSIAFSPSELRRAHADGKYLWGKCNWRIVDPQTLMRDETAAAESVRSHNATLKARIDADRVGA